MRYGEQICEITVPLDGVDIDAADLIERMVEQVHQRHEALYTYGAPDQGVVLVNTRLTVVGELPMLPTEPIVEATGAVAPRGSRRIYLGAGMDVPVYELDALSPGDEVEVPAIFESPTTAILVRLSDRADGSISGSGSDKEPYGTDRAVTHA